MKAFLNHSPELLLLIFLIVTFLQSGLDKIYDWKGNLNWLTGHFSETPLRGMVPVLLAIVMVSELVSSALCAIGAYQLLAMENNTVAFYGAICSCIALLMLLFGQRMAKDYEGAKTIAIYFIPAIFLVFLLRP